MTLVVRNARIATSTDRGVIDRGGVVRMNEDYKNGARLESVLDSLE